MAPASISPDWLRSRYRAALLILATIGAMSIALAIWLANAAGWVRHSRDVLRVSRDAHVQLLLEEAAIRGRVLTSDTTVWQSSTAARSAMRRTLDSLEFLTRDNAQQHHRAQEVIATVTRWWSDSAERAAAGSTAVAPPEVRAEGQARFAEAQRRFSDFVNSEQELYRRRARLEYLVRIATTAATLAGLVFLAILVIRFERDFATQSSALVAKSQALDQQLQASWDRLEALGVAKRRLEFLLESSPLATAIVDRDGVVEVANPAFHDLAATSDVAGTALATAIPRHDAVLAPLVAAALDEGLASINQEVVTDAHAPGEGPSAAPGTPRSTWLVNVYPLRTDAGETVGAGVVIADLTNERQREAQYRQAQRLESIGRLTGGIAHDFNNILTVIVGFGEMAALDVADSLAGGTPVDPHAADSLEQVLLAAGRASALTRQLLAYGRQQVLHPESLLVSGVVREVDAMLRRVIGEDVTLVTRLPESLWPVRVDRSQVEQILMNLAVNARDAMPDGGQLVIEARNVELDDAYASRHVGTNPGAHVLLAVSDNGSGMDAATAARAFEPWFTTKEPGRGTGLGLATVYGIVKQSGGSIELYSEPGHGTTFKIYLPRELATPTVASETPAARPARTPVRAARILLVEDDPSVALLAREVLTADGHTVTAASSGREALQLLDASSDYDLVITDMVMPELGGRALADELARRQITAKLIFMSGYSAEAVTQRTVLPPDAIFVEKPFRATDLQDVVRRRLAEE